MMTGRMGGWQSSGHVLFGTDVRKRTGRRKRNGARLRLVSTSRRQSECLIDLNRVGVCLLLTIHLLTTFANIIRLMTVMDL